MRTSAARFSTNRAQPLVALDPGVMARGEALEDEAGGAGELGQDAELDQLVAADARIGGRPGEVSVGNRAEQCSINWST